MDTSGRTDPVSHGTWDGYNNRSCRCQPCVDAGKVYRSGPRAKLVSKAATVRWRYNLPWEEFAALHEAQGGLCAICSVAISIFPGEPNPAAIDHDHSCCVGRANSCGKCIRGLLCRECNHGIGKFRDSPALLESAIKYLARGSNIRSNLDVFVLR